MNRIITHASLFSGIGAPELAAFWLGWQNAFHCEISKFCNTILNYWHPNSIGYENIKKTDFSKWKGKIDVLTGGFPCQPFSSAGQRLGANDDRYLWQEMLRAIRQVQPTFVIGENVAGILSMVQPCEAVKVGITTSLSSVRTTIYTERNSSSSSKPYVQTLSVKDTPSNRLLFRLVPSVRHTKGTGCGSSPEGMFPHLLLTPCTREFCEDPTSMRARAKRNGYRNGTKYNSLLSQIVYSDMLPTPVTQGLKVCEDGRQKFYPQELLPTPLTVEIQHSKRVRQLRAKGGRTKGSRKHGEQKGLPEMFRKPDWLLTPMASDGRRSMMTMDNLKAHKKTKAEQSNLAEQIAHKVGGGTSQLSPLFVEEMMGYPLMYLVLPFLLPDGDRNQ